MNRAARGYVLLDAVAALAVVVTGLALALGAVSAVGRIAIRQAERVHAIVEQRNADAKDRGAGLSGR
jgi:bifunctional N-acetylglucosamine-1-phosphate-uridyltransferase/glucosamine-1-phosphate-acetyltransferase GlmU-like protein